MNKMIRNFIAVLSFAFMLLTPTALAEGISRSTAYAVSGSDWGFTLSCVAAFASLVWLGITTIRRTKYKEI